MCEMGNTPMEIIPGTPADVSSLRKGLIQMLSQKVGDTSARKWEGGFQTPMNKMQKAAMSSTYNRMGGGSSMGGPDPLYSQGQSQSPQGFQGSPQDAMLRAMLAQRARQGQVGMA